MSQEAVERLAQALLYEGYMLYPYRPSSVKNQSRFNFGVLYPPAYSQAQASSDRSWMQTECLVEGSPETRINVQVRFLHLQERTVARLRTSSSAAPDQPSAFESVERLPAGSVTYLPWQEAVEREVRIPGRRLDDLLSKSHQEAFRFPYTISGEPLPGDGPMVGIVHRECQTVDGEVVLSAAPCGKGVFRLRVTVRNGTEVSPDIGGNRDAALPYSLVSAHSILCVTSGSWVSLLDPPTELRDMAARCENLGTWPVLVGEAGRRDTMLSSPIIIYDYPEIAPESAGDLFDGTEIDEILSLRIMTLSDAEKAEMRSSDDRARRILERTESLGTEEMMKMHGIMRPVGGSGEEAR